MDNRDIAKMTDKEKENILKELTEWIYVDYGDAEFFICPLCETIIDLPQKEPNFQHLRNCPFYKGGE